MPIRVGAGLALPSTGQTWPVPMYPQQATEWCWLACAQMAGDTPPNGEGLEQYTLAERYIPGATGCNASPVPNGCNLGGSADDIQKIYRDLSLGFVAVPVAGQPNEPELVAWIEKGPVQVFWATPVEAHVALIVAVQLLGDTYRYTVNDPWPVDIGQVRPLTYDQLLPTIHSEYTWGWECFWHC